MARSVGSSVGADERRHAVAPMGDEVAGLGPELGDELDGGGAARRWSGRRSMAAMSGALAGEPAPVGPEPGRAVDDGDPGARGPRRGAGRCWRPPPARSAASASSGKLDRSPDHPPLDLHGEHGGPAAATRSATSDRACSSGVMASGGAGQLTGDWDVTMVFAHR